MKFKKNILYSLIIITVVLSSSSIIYANSSNRIGGKQVGPMTESEKKIEIMLNDAHTNLKETFEIDDESYVKIDSRSLNDLHNGKIAEFKNKKFGSEAAQLIHGTKFPFGYTVPLIYIKNDKSEIILCAKNEAGESMMITLKSNNGNWDKSMVQKNGKPNLKIKDIKVDN